MFALWVIMIVGMMLPSAAPMTLLYAGMVPKGERQGTPMAPIAVFVSGYVAMWGVFSVGATFVQWVLHESAMLSAMMMAKSPVLGAGLLIVAGVYQLTPWKAVCLKHCRSLAHFFAEHWRPEGLWRVLFGVLLGFDGVVVGGRRVEPSLDRGDYDLCVSGEGAASSQGECSSRMVCGGGLDSEWGRRFGLVTDFALWRTVGLVLL